MNVNIEQLELKVAEAMRGWKYGIFPDGRAHALGRATAYNQILCELLGITGDDVTDNLEKCFEKHKEKTGCV